MPGGWYRSALLRNLCHGRIHRVLPDESCRKTDGEPFLPLLTIPGSSLAITNARVQPWTNKITAPAATCQESKRGPSRPLLSCSHLELDAVSQFVSVVMIAAGLSQQQSTQLRGILMQAPQAERLRIISTNPLAVSSFGSVALAGYDTRHSTLLSESTLREEFTTRWQQRSDETLGQRW